jgi:hypothetical protein
MTANLFLPNVSGFAVIQLGFSGSGLQLVTKRAAHQTSINRPTDSCFGPQLGRSHRGPKANG